MDTVDFLFVSHNNWLLYTTKLTLGILLNIGTGWAVRFIVGIIDYILRGVFKPHLFYVILFIGFFPNKSVAKKSHLSDSQGQNGVKYIT